MRGAHYDVIEHGGATPRPPSSRRGSSTSSSPPYEPRRHRPRARGGQRVAYHTCGGMMPILERLVGLGSNALETFTPPAMGGDVRLAEAKRRVGGQVCLIGGFDQNRFFVPPPRRRRPGLRSGGASPRPARAGASSSAPRTTSSRPSPSSSTPSPTQKPGSAPISLGLPPPPSVYHDPPRTLPRLHELSTRRPGAEPRGRRLGPDPSRAGRGRVWRSTTCTGTGSRGEPRWDLDPREYIDVRYDSHGPALRGEGAEPGRRDGRSSRGLTASSQRR